MVFSIRFPLPSLTQLLYFLIIDYLKRVWCISDEGIKIFIIKQNSSKNFQLKSQEYLVR